jgi:hydroxymethylbilane synthase
MATRLVIGSRGSDLALYQANFIKDVLTTEHGCEVEIKIIKTSGDKIDNLSFDKMEGKGFFTKELEEALLEVEIDLAVHSLKDLMTSQPEGLKLGAAGYRADRRELLLINRSSYDESNGVIPVVSDGTVGTSSARRKCQIAHHNSSLKIADLRGNVPTRVKKLRDGQYDAIVLAAAGVARLQLDLTDLQAVYLDPEVFLPAPAQGILGIQIRSNDPRVEDVVAKLGTREELATAALERGLLKKFGSGCSLPLGVYSESKTGTHRLKAVLGVIEDERWVGLKKIDITGDNIESIVDEAYESLKAGKTCYSSV